jgi:hypothetical protein
MPYELSEKCAPASPHCPACGQVRQFAVFDQLRRGSKRKGPAQWPAPLVSRLAFSNNWRRRGFALAVVPVSVLCASSDAKHSQRRCRQ